MPFVVISIGGEEVSRHPVTRSMVVGRSVDADVSVRDASMSRWHCRIEPNPDKPGAGVSEKGAWVLTDLGSRNGTSLNGRKITRQTLHHGDLLRIGRVNVFFSMGDFVPGPSRVPVTRRGRRAEMPELSVVSSAETLGVSPFPTPLLTVDSRLPRPDPAKPTVRRASAIELEIMSSPGWSAKARPTPTPSVDMSPGELLAREQSRTVDITHLNPATRAVVAKPGVWKRFVTWVGEFFGR